MTLKDGDFVWFDNAIVKVNGDKIINNIFIYNTAIYCNANHCEWMFEQWCIPKSAPYLTFSNLKTAYKSKILELCKKNEKANTLFIEAVTWLIEREECLQNNN
jgi:hypothetical protein